MEQTLREQIVGEMALSINVIGIGEAYRIMAGENPPIAGWTDFAISLMVYDMTMLMKDKPIFAPDEFGNLQRRYANAPFEELFLNV